MRREMTFNDVRAIDRIDEPCAAFVMEEDAFRSFYDRNARALWAYLARVTGDPHLADDLLQESFYRFLRAASTHQTEAHRRNSLYRIATNLARDARRRNGVRPSIGVTGDEVETLAAHDPPAEERVADVTQAMSKLKPREREMLWLAYAEGATHCEIASALGLRASSMKVLLSRARRNLAKLLRITTGGTGR